MSEQSDRTNGSEPEDVEPEVPDAEDSDELSPLADPEGLSGAHDDAEDEDAQ
jgi:hypothetical protein